MKEGKTGQCIHRITAFQAHRGCQELAAICEKNCQEPHKADDDRILISVEAVEEQFNSIRLQLIQEVKSYTEPVCQLYNQINQELHNQQTEHLKEMEQELLSHLLKQVSLQKPIVQKIENKRYERVNCQELMTFLEVSNIQEKIKKSALPTLSSRYKTGVLRFKNNVLEQIKHLRETKTPSATSSERQKTEVPFSESSSLPQNHFKHKPEVMSSSNLRDSSEPPKVAPTHFQDANRLRLWQEKVLQLEKHNRELISELQKLKFQGKVLTADKKNLLRELGKRQIKDNRDRMLTYNTWNIVKVVTKKIKKLPRPSTEDNKKQGSPKVSHHTPVVMIEEDLGEDLRSASDKARLSDEEVPKDAECGGELDKKISNQKAERAIMFEIESDEQEGGAMEKKGIQVDQGMMEVDRVIGASSGCPQSTHSRMEVQKDGIQGPLAILDVGRQVSVQSQEKEDDTDFFSFFRKKIL